MVVQSLIFSKEKFTEAEAKAWAREHDYKSSGVDETEDSYRIRQRDPGDFVSSSFRTVELDTGVSAVMGHLKSASSSAARAEYDLVEPGSPSSATEIEPLPSVVRVEIRGPIEQRAGYHADCMGWGDGYDAIGERMAEALESGDVLLVIDSPGGACAGLAECVRRIQAKKAHTGRRITVYVDECCCSAAYWIAASVADEIFVPEMGVIGSIGARSSWYGCAGALAKDGIETRYFAFPPGKVAFAPELPLSDAGAERGQRDIMLAFEAFAAAVDAGRGLSRDALVQLDADALTGAAAVQAGLADGVETFESVAAYALAMAVQTSQETKTMPEKREEMPEKPEDAGAEEEEYEEEGEEEPGQDMQDEDEDEEGPPSSVPPSARRSSPAASLSVLAGVPAGSSELAIRTALAGRVSVYQHAARVTGRAAPGEITGALDAIAKDAAAVGRMRAERDDALRKSNAAERMQLLRKLAAMGTHTAGELFRYDAGPGGERVIAGPAKLWGPGPSGRTLANLRGYVAQCEARAPGTPAPRAARDPFQPKPAASRTAPGEPTQAEVDAAKQHPAVLNAFNRPGNTQTLDALARTHARHFPSTGDLA